MTTEWSHVTTIGWIELRRRWRTLKGNTGQLLAIAVVGLFALPFTAIALFALFFFGTGVRSGDIETPIEFARLGLVYAWIFVVAFGGYRAYATALRPDRLDGLLTTVSHRELLGGLLFAELVLWGVPAALFVSLGAVAFAAGAGSVFAAPVTVVTVCIALATALTGGFLVALVVRNTGVRSKLLTRLRTVLLTLVGLVYFGLIFTQAFDTVLAPLYWLLEPTPVGWYGDLLLLGTVSEASIGRGIGAILTSGVFLLASGVVLSRLAEWLWYADGVHVDRRVEVASSSANDSYLTAVLPRPIAGVVVTDWKRARRAPITLSFVLYPLIVVIGPITTTIQTGTVGGEFPLWIVLCGAWITGALFTLNVLGNEGAVLPSALLGADPGRSLVYGHVVASVLVGTPLTAVATLGLGIASPRPLSSVAILSASALVVTVCAALIATGVGAVFPRFDEVSVSRSTKAIVPSMLAFAVYSIVLLLVSLPVLVGQSTIVGHAIASWAGTSRLLVGVSGSVLTGLGALSAGVVSARYAVRSVETFHFE